LHKSGLRLRSILRDPEGEAAANVKYKDKTIDWINLHYNDHLSLRKGEYLLEKELMEVIIAQLTEESDWKVILYEYKLHRWNGDLIFVRDENSEKPTVLVVEAKVLTGVQYDEHKLNKVIEQAETYRELARGLFHGKCRVFSVAVLNAAVDGVNYFDRLFIPKSTLKQPYLVDSFPENWIIDWRYEDIRNSIWK